MRNILFQLQWLVGLACLAISCTPKNSPVYRQSLSIDTVFTQAYAKHYGKHYAGLERQVFSLDLYSDGLTLDNNNRLQGTGTNLYFSDIFVNSDLLESGTYTVDSTADAHTALSAMDFEGEITGTYLLMVNEGNVEKIYLFPSGHFNIDFVEDTCVMDFHLLTTDKQTYDATFRGVIKAN
jgi:hypothetical protein